MEVCDAAASAVREADAMQESGPERLDVKRELFATVERHVGPHVTIFSSRSGIVPSALARGPGPPGRPVIGHPFNPPHIFRLLKSCWARRRTARLSRRRWRSTRAREVAGGAAPGDQRFRRTVCPQRSSRSRCWVVSQEQLDLIVTESLGVRWATSGPFQSMHLGGGPGGRRHMLEHLGPGVQG